MNIANLMGTSTANALEAVYGENSKKHREDPLAVPSWSEDTISISEAARALAALAKEEDSEQGLNSDDEQQSANNGLAAGYATLAAKRVAARSSSIAVPAPASRLDETEEEKQADEKDATSSTASTNTAPAGSSSSMRSSPGDAIAKLQGKLKELQQKLIDAQNSSLPEQTKGAMISSIGGQIGQVVQEINELSQNIQA